MENDKNQTQSWVPILNNVEERLLILSPTVKLGLEKECNKSDFYREGDKFIGKGGFGEVWKVAHKKLNKIFVIKVIDKKSIKAQNLVKQMNREIEIMYQVHHPHCMPWINHFEDDDKFFLIMPYAGKGQVYTWLRRQVRFDQRTAAQYMRETIEAVRYWHQLKIIHRDIKPENLLLDDNYRIKLSDFGWSNFKEDEDTRKTYCGTPEYLSPEMVRKLPHDYNVDIWSWGVLLFEFLAGFAPFTGSNQNELFMNIKRLKINWPIDFPPWAKNWVSKILKLNPKDRPSLNEILNHSWFEQNPPYRPVLVNAWTDPKLILKSHLINDISDSIQDELSSAMDDSCKQRRKQSIASLRKINSNWSSISNSSNPEMQNLVIALQNENEKLKKENKELNESMAKHWSDMKSSEEDIINLKNNWIQNEKSSSWRLNEEIEKYKVWNVERCGWLSELEQKNNNINELKNQCKGLETERETLRQDWNIFNIKINELSKQWQSKENDIGNLNTKISEWEHEKEVINNHYQKKIIEIQIDMLDKAEETGNWGPITRVIEVLNNTIQEIKEEFSQKMERLILVLTQSKEDFQRRDEVFSKWITDENKNWLDIVTSFKDTFNKDFLDLQNKLEDQSSMKRKQNIEWYKEQWNELWGYKSKYITRENKWSQWEMENKNCITQMNWAINERQIAVTKEQLKQEWIEKQDDEIEHWKSKIEDVLQFWMEHSKTKPEKFLVEFKSWYYSKSK